MKQTLKDLGHGLTVLLVGLGAFFMVFGLPVLAIHLKSAWPVVLCACFVLVVGALQIGQIRRASPEEVADMVDRRRVFDP